MGILFVVLILWVIVVVYFIFKLFWMNILECCWNRLLIFWCWELVYIKLLGISDDKFNGDDVFLVFILFFGIIVFFFVFVCRKLILEFGFGLIIYLFIVLSWLFMFN